MKKILRIFGKTLLVLFVLVNVITAFHAYKFTHFYNADEITVKLPEEKSGWDKTREILFGINAVKKKNDVATDSVFQTVHLKTKNGLTLEAWYIPTDSAVGTVCLFHGHGGNKSGVFNESLAFRKMGYNTFLLDFRAHGNSEGNTCTIGYDESEDVKLAYDYIKNKGEKNIVLWGISMGAAAVSKSVSDYDLAPQKIILEMPFGSIVQAGEGRIKMMHLPPEPLATLITFWGGIEHGFWAFGMKPSEFVKKIKCPVLLQWGMNDPRVSRGEIDAIYNNISTTKKLVLYSNCGHESLCKKETEKWKSQVSDFLR
jgi:alpha-beta hydrolase superfamily lysophospholipase